jgi:hypothetical protein
VNLDATDVVDKMRASISGERVECLAEERRVSPAIFLMTAMKNLSKHSQPTAPSAATPSLVKSTKVMAMVSPHLATPKAKKQASAQSGKGKGKGGKDASFNSCMRFLWVLFPMQGTGSEYRLVLAVHMFASSF